MQSKSAFGLVFTSIRVFLRAPVLFVLLSAAQIAPALVTSWTAAGTASFAGTVELVLTELIIVLMQTPIVDQALRLLRDTPRSWRDTLRTSAARALPMAGVIVLQLVIVAAGSVALLLPGVIAYLMVFLATPVCVAERAGPLQSLSRSCDITRGARWRILGAILVLVLPIGLIVRALATLAGTSSGIASDHVFDVIGALSGTLLTILSAVIYEDLKTIRAGEQITAVFA